MSLRQKTLLFFCCLCLILFSAVFVISRIIILDNFQVLEQQNTQQNLDRVKNAFNVMISSLDIIAQDYAGWDDTYNFIQTQSKDYVESNLVDETFVSNDYNLMAFINSDNKIVYSKLYDLQQNQEISFNEDLMQYLDGKSPLLTYDGNKGLKGVILLQQNPMIIVSRPILTSEKKGPSLGSLIIGKYLDSDTIESLKKTTGINLSIERSYIFGQTSTGQVIKPENNNIISGYETINDINNNPAFTFKIELNREIYQQGKKAVVYLVVMFLIISLVGVSFSLIYLDKYMLSPLKSLVTDVNLIKSTADFSIIVRETGKGEFSLLARDINKMINALASGEKALRVVNKKIEFEKANVEKIVEARTQQLREEQALFISSINSVPEGFIILDTSRQVIINNNIVSKIFGLNHPELTFSKIVNEFKGYFSFEQVYLQCINSKMSATYDEIAFRNKILKIFLAPVFLLPESGELTGLVVVIEDITEAKKLEKSKEEFFAIASHELRTPLTAIKGNTQMIQKYYSGKINDTNFNEMLNDLYLSSVRLIDIVNIFLTTSRLEQRKIEFNIVPFNINELALEVNRRMQSIAQSKQLELVIKETDINIIVLGDKNRTEEILLNLVSNAINYTNTGSVTVTLKKDENYAYVSVEDTGKGIAKENQSLLFQKFQQLNDALYTRNISQGTGLGLYISRLMIEAMKGTIYLEQSELAKGSTFTFTLPLKK